MEVSEEKVKNQCSKQHKQDMNQKKKMQMVTFDPMMCATDYQGYTTMDLLGTQTGYSSSCLTELLSLKSRMFLAAILFGM